jgi:hypothetical protein
MRILLLIMPCIIGLLSFLTYFSLNSVSRKRDQWNAMGDNKEKCSDSDLALYIAVITICTYFLNIEYHDVSCSQFIRVVLVVLRTNRLFP